MDTYKAKQLEQILKGQKFLNYEIINLLNNGKSSVVFKAKDLGGNFYAVKIFDNDLIERFGHEIQEKRIEQEISLKGHTISNLVKIIDGGKTQIESNEYYYIVMEYINGQNLKQFISSSTYDNSFLQKVVKTLFNISEALLAKGIVHRDIKPENIMINENGEIVLLDLGVLKLIGVPSFTDQDKKQFVGTLRYAPPEFLTRNEEDSRDGWKSVNLYQIGGILHDLIMKKELFNEYTPFSTLVLAIKEDVPTISNADFPFSTIQLARDLLVKDWKKRLALCMNQRIESFYLNDPNNISSIDKEIEDVLSMTSGHKSKFEEIEKITRSNKEKADKRIEISNQLEKVIDESLELLKQKGLFQRITKSQLFYFDSDKENRITRAVKNYLYKIEGDITQGFSRPVYLFTKFNNDENFLAQISLMSMVLWKFIKIDLVNPINMFRRIGQEQRGKVGLGPVNEMIIPTTYDAFNGTAGFDEQFKEKITSELNKIIKTALKGISPEVTEELEQLKRIAKGEQDSNVRTSPKTIMFYKPESA